MDDETMVKIMARAEAGLKEASLQLLEEVRKWKAHAKAMADSAELANVHAEKFQDEVERLRGMMVEAARLAYLEGHNDTVESRFGDPLEAAVDLIADLRDIIFEEAEDIRDARAALAGEEKP